MTTLNYKGLSIIAIKIGLISNDIDNCLFADNDKFDTGKFKIIRNVRGANNIDINGVIL